MALFIDCAFAGTARRAAYVPNPGRALKPDIRLLSCCNGEQKARRRPGSPSDSAV